MAWRRYALTGYSCCGVFPTPYWYLHGNQQRSGRQNPRAIFNGWTKLKSCIMSSDDSLQLQVQGYYPLLKIASYPFSCWSAFWVYNLGFHLPVIYVNSEATLQIWNRSRHILLTLFMLLYLTGRLHYQSMIKVQTLKGENSAPYKGWSNIYLKDYRENTR